MHSVLAIARVTLKDALRKKVLFTILFFAVLLTVVSGFLPSVMAEEQIRQVTRICLSGIGFFGMVVAIFLSAPSLPDDISAKTIFTVMSKPARRWHIIAGKVLGLAYVLLIMLVVMGGLSYSYIRIWAWKMGPEKSGLPRLEGNEHIYAESAEYHGLTLDISKPMIESKRAIASGLDRITFHFSGLDKVRFSGETVFARITLFKHSWDFDPRTKEGTAALEVTNPTTGETFTEVFGAAMLRPVSLGFPRSLIGKDGQLNITVARHLPSGSYSAMASSVAVLSQPSNFGVNFAKALAMMFMQYMVLVFMAVSASTFLTSTVSTIMALFIYFTGSFVEVLRKQALALGTQVNIFTMAEHRHEAMHEELSGAAWVINIALRYFYLGISIVFPNLDYFNMSARISENEYISWGTLWHGLVYGAVYAAAAFAVAYAVFKRKEVA